MLIADILRGKAAGSTLATTAPSATVGELLSLMKVTRQSAGVVFLAYEQKDWNAVLGGEARAREVIAGTRQALQSVKRP